MVLQQGTEIGRSMRGEEERVEVEAEVLEGVVGGSEDGGTFGGVFEGGG